VVDDRRRSLPVRRGVHALTTNAELEWGERDGRCLDAKTGTSALVCRTRSGLRSARAGRFSAFVVLDICASIWLLGCGGNTGSKDDVKSGLERGETRNSPDAGCVMTAKINCPLRCSEIDFDAVCDATLGGACDGQCNAEATGTCLDDCGADCAIGWKAGSNSDCEVSCFDMCGDSCKTLCAGSMDPTQCNETCSGQCHSTCTTKCAASADSSCDGSCKASCNATCSVQANVACKLRCSVDGFTTCKARAAARCVAERSSTVMLTCP